MQSDLRDIIRNKQWKYKTECILKKVTDLQRLDVKGLVWTGSSVSWIFWKCNIQYLMAKNKCWRHHV